MTFTKVITAVIIAFSATTSLAETKCDHKGTIGRFANTNPQIAKTKVAQASGTASSQAGAR